MLWTASKPCVPLNDREHNPGEDGGPGRDRNEAHELCHERPESAEDDAGLANKLSRAVYKSAGQPLRFSLVASLLQKQSGKRKAKSR